MPFLPSSPTGLYQKRKSKHASFSLGKAKTSPSSIAEERETVQEASSNLCVDPSTVDGLATMSDSGSPKRKSMSSFRGATVGHNLDQNAPLGARDDGSTSRRSTTSTITVNPVDAILSAAMRADESEAGLPPDSLDETSPTTLTRRSSICDNTSDSEYSVAEDIRPVIGRASSVRVSKPQIVQHKPTTLAKPHGGFQVHPTFDSHAPRKVERIVEEQPEMLANTTGESTPRASHDGTSPAATKDDQTEKSTASGGFSSTITPSQGGLSEGGRGASSDVPMETATALPTGNTLHSGYPGILNSEASARDQTAVQPGDEAEPAQLLNRAMSSPLPLPGKGISRRVTIRPTDLIIKNHNTQSSFRESVVTTPYPTRISSDSSSMDFGVKEGIGGKESKKAKEKERRRVSFSHVSSDISSRGAKDRFPSPERPEVLFLDLNLLRHPNARTTIEIQIADKSTFDDELFFQQIRTAYSKQLLGVPRLAFTLVRRIGNVSVTAPENYDAAEFDSISFIKHFQDPSLGRKRKAWVIWLRNNNPRSAAPTATIASPKAAFANKIDNLNRLSLRTRMPRHSRHSSGNKSHHTDRDNNNDEENKRFSTASEANSFHFVYSPAVLRLPFLPRNDNGQSHSHSDSPGAHAVAGSPCRSFFWPSDFSSSSASRSRLAEESEAVKIVTLSFHHEFRTGIIALFTLLVILQAVLASVIWVIFGVPGTRPGMDGEQQIAGGHTATNMDWRIHARTRVLTGVVIGLVVLLIGGLVEGALVWGSWLML